MQNTYGILSNGTHHDVAKTERGAKRYATLNGYDTVTVRWNCGYHADIAAQKVNGKWHSLLEQVPPPPPPPLYAPVC